MVESKQKWKAWVYLAPALVILAVFTFYPIVKTVIIAFLDGYNPLKAGAVFNLGIQNFIDVFANSEFSTCLKNTLLLCVLTVPLSCIIGLLVAVALNNIPKFSNFLQTIYFLPYVTNSIAIGMVFAMMFNIIGLNNISVEDYEALPPAAKNGLYWITTKTISSGIFDGGGGTITKTMGMTASSWGIINNFIMLLGGDPINWINIGSSTTLNGVQVASVANYAVIVVYIVWNALPFKILILLGGLQSVNKQYYEAAKIDGASKSTVFFRITVPLLSPMIAYVVITAFIGGFKEYTSIVGIYGDYANGGMGAPGATGTLNTMVGYVYSVLPNGYYGKASAASLILFAIIFVVTLLNLYVSKKKVHY